MIGLTFEAVRAGRAAIMRALVLLLLWAACCAATGASMASGQQVRASEGVVRVGEGVGQIDLRPASTFFRDPTRLRRVDDVVALADRFAPLPDVPPGQSVNLGYDKAAIWLRFTLELDADADGGGARRRAGPWLLELGYPSLDRVSLHWQDAAGQWQSAETGDRIPQSQRPLMHHSLLLPVELEPGVPQTFFLRVQSEGNLTIPLTLWTERALAEADRGAYLWHAAYFGALLALLIYNLMLYFAVRERVYLAYVAMVLGMGLGQAALTGFGSRWLWPEAVVLGDRMLPMAFALCGLAGALFTRLFLDLQRSHPRGDRLVIAIAVLFGGQLVFGFWLPYAWRAMIVSATGLGFAVLAVALGGRCLAEGQRAARFFLIGWLLLLLGVAVMALRNFALLPTNWLTSHLMQIGSLVEMLLLAIALADRINSLRAEMDRAHVASAEADRRLVSTLRDWGKALEQQVSERTRDLSVANTRLQQSEAQERRLREEQQHFIAMIAHEIRTPLAVIQAATQSLRELEGGSALERLKRYDRIGRAMQRVGVLLDVALAQDRTSVAEWTMDCAEVDLEALSHELCELIPASDQFRVKVTVARPLPELLGDVKMLRVAGVNLLENALKYSDPLAPVHIALEAHVRDGVEGVLWAFEDSGPGIPPGSEEKIFEKYFRAKGGYGKPGLGIGLFLARFICERHGGWLGLSSPQPEQGARFEIWLPLHGARCEC